MNLEGLLRALRNTRTDGVHVRAWSLSANERRRLSLGVKDRQAGGPHAPIDLSETCAARYLLVWSDGRVSKGTLERRQIERHPEHAVASTRAHAYDDPDAAHVADPSPVPAVALFDEEVAAMASGDTALLARRLAAIRARVADARFKNWSGAFSSVETTSRTANSSGLDVVERSTSTGWHVSFEGEFGDGFSGRASEDEHAFSGRLDRLVPTVRLLLGTVAPAPAGDVPVLLHPNVVEEYVLDTLFHNLDGGAVSHGESAFQIGQFGSSSPVLREDLVLRLDPLLPMRSGSYRLSGEGVPARPTTFIEGGRLATPILDLKYARRLRRAPTALPYAMDTVALEGSPPLPLEQALRSCALLVLHVLGVHTQDPTSGDFSLAAPQGLAVRDGILDGRVRSTISGNVFQLLRREDTALVTFQGETTPGLLVHCHVA